MSKTHKSYVIIRVALILLCLVLFTAHLSSGMLAKYTVSGDGDDVARAANAKVTVTSSQTAPDIAADGIATYSFTVDNTAEVAYNYRIFVYIDPAVTLTQTQLAKAFGSPKLNGTALTFDTDENAYIYNCADAFVPGDTTDYTLTFQADDLAATSSSITSNSAVYENVKINIAVKTVQID